jgi:very-short-patch-repair endonuclease
MAERTLAEKIGLTGCGFLAGARRAESWWDRRLLIESCSYLVLWIDKETDALMWADAVAARALGKRVFFALPNGMSEAGVQMLWSNPGQLLEYCPSVDVVFFVAVAFACHDPQEQARAGNHGIPGLFEVLRLCESPIEARLAVHLFSEIQDETMCALMPQVSIGQYRVDFTITSHPAEKEKINLVIECDGHDFHERTKEQAARDKKRDRELVAEGWQVLRFTGSEIWNDPRGCVAQIYKIIDNQGGALR